ncbi:hypothetical protein, partial [Streptococcus canis]|uniref:hypothetical protein n=1 Tax=Streptococcus canis TaxID=1329 RepID=UPI0013DB6E51
MRKNMSLCRRVVGTSLLAITLFGMSSVGVNKVAADTTQLQSELQAFVDKFKNYTEKKDDKYKGAVASLSDEALNYLMFRVVADYNINPGYFSEGSFHTTANDLNYLGTRDNTKNEEARKIVFEEMRKRIKERDQFKSNNQLLTDEVKYQRGENNKLNEKNLTLSEAMVTHYQNLQKAEEEKAKLSQDLDKKTTDLKNLTEQFRLTLLKDESDKKKLETERDKLATQLSQANQSNAELEAKAKELKEQADTATQNLQTSQEKVKELDQKVAAAITQNKTLQAQLEKGQSELQELTQKLQATEELNAEAKAKLQQELDAKQKEVEGLQGQVAESANKL